MHSPRRLDRLIRIPRSDHQTQRIRRSSRLQYIPTRRQALSLGHKRQFYTLGHLEVESPFVFLVGGEFLFAVEQALLFAEETGFYGGSAVVDVAADVCAVVCGFVFGVEVAVEDERDVGDFDGGRGCVCCGAGDVLAGGEVGEMVVVTVELDAQIGGVEGFGIDHR